MITVQLCLVATHSVQAQGTDFTYQGRLLEGGAPADGLYEFRFGLYDDPSGASARSGFLTNSAVVVSGGLFTTALDFGEDALVGTETWLEIAVRADGSSSGYTILAPRQLLTATPYAVWSLRSDAAVTAGHATTAGSAGSADAALTAGHATTADSALAATQSLTADNALSVAEGAVGNAGLQTGSVTSEKVVDGTIGLVDLDLLSVGAAFWRTDGNAGTTPGAQFLGTTDNQPLELRVNGMRGLRLEPAVNQSPNVILGSADNAVAPGVFGTTIAGGGVRYPTWSASNRVDSDLGTLGGGMLNFIGTDSFAAVVGGGQENRVETNADHSTIGGGVRNSIDGASAGVVAGGGYGRIGSGSSYAVIGGGGFNEIGTNAFNSTIMGGYGNQILDNAKMDTIGGGWHNSIRNFSEYATIGGGGNNLIMTNSDASVIGGGAYNVIGNSSYYSVIPGGRSNVVKGYYSLAAGRGAQALHDSTLVWSDDQDGDFVSTHSRQFLIRAGSGVGIGTNDPQSALHVAGTVTADSFRGTGTGLTALDASALSTGALPDGRLSDNVARRSGGNTFAGDQVLSSGALGIGATPVDAALEVNGIIRLVDQDLMFRGGNDRNHGLGYYAAAGKVFASTPLDGPVLYGWQGGALGSLFGGQRIALRWNASGRVGIGKNDPQAPLDIDVNPGEAFIRLRSAGMSWPVMMHQSSASIFTITNGHSTFAIAAGGNVGIGTNNPAQRLHVAGRLRLDTWTADGNTTVYKSANGDLGLLASDIRLKKNLARIDDALNKVMGLRGVLFNWRDQPDDARKSAGLIAQEAAAVLPELTYQCQGEDGETYLGVHYDQVTALLVNAIQEQQIQIENQRVEMDQLRDRLERLEELMARSE